MADRQQELDHALRAILWAMQKNEEVTQHITAAAEHIKKAGGVPGHAPQVVDSVGEIDGTTSALRRLWELVEAAKMNKNDSPCE